MEETLYWIIEYCKVLFGYGFLIFIWPMVVFREYLRGKSVTFRFSFCVVGQMVLVNTVVLMLGLLHILNDWTLRILFYGTFLYSIRELYWLTPERKRKFKYLVNGTFGWKNFLMLERRKLIRVIEEFCKRIGRFYKKHWLEYSLLLVAVVYGVIYFSWGVFQEHSYGFSDMYVHHSWTYQLSQGNVFSAGIYPEGMHCVLYALKGLFGIELYNCMLFVPSVNVIVVLIAAYCLMKELFRWRYSAVFVLIAMLTFGALGRYVIICMARMQCALPQEFAFSAIFICCLYLLRYLKGGRKYQWKGKITKGYWDENLLVFMLALAATIEIHFYATFMAFFLCVGVAVYLWKRIFTRERFVPLITAAVVAVLLAAAPMVAGYATGIPLQGSLNWALGVMQESSARGPATTTENGLPEVNTSGDVTNPLPGQTPEESEDWEAVTKEISVFEKITGKVMAVGTRVLETCKTVGNTIYTEAYLAMYEENFAKTVLVILSVVLLGGSLAAGITVGIGKVKKVKMKYPGCGGYFIITISSFVYIVVYAATFLGLPVLLERSRICFISNLLVMMTVMIPVDMLLCAAAKLWKEKLLHAVSFVIACGIVATVYFGGLYHGYLYFELTRFDATVQVTNQIMKQLPQYSYTIVSPTEELYQVIEDGRHEEWIDFIDKQEWDTYKIPTEYVFLFVEKKPFRYAQYHFFDGPRWLAYDRYQEMYGTCSTTPGYLVSELSEEDAEKKIMRYSKMSQTYAAIESRKIVQSKLTKWCRMFEKLYPNEFKTYYEDEYFVCYYFRQNPQNLYNLRLE